MRNSGTVFVGKVPIGGGHPIVIQSMTNTATENVDATVAQIQELHAAGAEIVRVTVDTEKAAAVIPMIKTAIGDIPLVGDFHFNGHLLLERFPEMASSLDKWRINPGNLGRGEKRDVHFETILRLAKEHEKPLRIGGNGGSLDPEFFEVFLQEAKKKSPSARTFSEEKIFEKALVDSVLRSAQKALDFGIPEDKLILSAKVSSLPSLLRVYRQLTKETTLPLHLGLTESGSGPEGITASAAALGILLSEGIGDTIRVSLTPTATGGRTEEIRVAKALLSALELRQFGPKITSCPGCGRTTGNAFQHFVEQLKIQIDADPALREAKLHIAVMGCIVNGIGEAEQADVGLFFPGKGEGKKATVYLHGKKYTDLQSEHLLEDFLQILRQVTTEHCQTKIEMSYLSKVEMSYEQHLGGTKWSQDAAIIS